jgi:hypothetical protein
MSKYTRIGDTDGKLKFLRSLKLNLGLIYASSKETGISVEDHNRWMQEDGKYKKQVLEIDGHAIDYVESTLLKLVEEKNPQAIMFYLKTKGKDRGYVEKSNQTDPKDKGEDLPFDMSREDKRKIIHKLMQESGMKVD